MNLFIIVVIKHGRIREPRFHIRRNDDRSASSFDHKSELEMDRDPLGVAGVLTRHELEDGIVGASTFRGYVPFDGLSFINDGGHCSITEDPDAAELADRRRSGQVAFDTVGSRILNMRGGTENLLRSEFNDCRCLQALLLIKIFHNTWTTSRHLDSKV